MKTMIKYRQYFTLLVAIILSIFQLTAQTRRDSTNLNMMPVIGNALNGNMPQAIQLLGNDDNPMLIRRHALLRKELTDRFSYPTDISSYDERHRSGMDSLLSIYKSYWRKSLLSYPKINDSTLIADLQVFFNIDSRKSENGAEIAAAIDTEMKKYIYSKGYFGIGFSRTGKYYDLQIWKAQHDTIYLVRLGKQTVRCPMVFMEGFVTHGWQEYATADKIFPGGWATGDSLFCCKASYDLNSEKFRISFLNHEARHFSDYKEFPGLSNPDLEYRAKLTELSLAKKTLFELITFFISASSQSSTDGHQLGNYYVIRDLSRYLFETEFETHMAKWESVGGDKIRKASAKLLKKNSAHLVKNNNSYIPD